MSRVDEIIARLQGFDREVRVEFEKRRSDFRFVIDEKRLRFGQDVIALQQLRFKRGVLAYISRARPLSWLATPVIWLGIVPVALLDLFVVVYQAACFPAYDIPKVKRSEYVVLDRGDLEYLNAIEKLNCVYCGYANGVAGLFREVAARTEQYWCPIKHARRIVAEHDYYPNFFEHGDAESYRLGLERLRRALAEVEAPS